MRDALLGWANARGYRIAWGPWSVVEDLRREFSERRLSGEIGTALDREYLNRLPWSPDGRGEGGTVVLVAVPRAAHGLTFQRPGARRQLLLLPPTYVRFRVTREEVLADLSQEVFGGEPIKHLGAPLKAAAARLGLVRYGRNNVTYAEGLGSSLQLVGGVLHTGLSEGAASPSQPAMLDACRSCTACIEACPTQAILRDRFLIDAERCIVFHNERPDPLPGWIPASAHRCAIGCMVCQQVCPANRSLLKVERDSVVFTEEETRRILSGGEGEDPLLRSAEGKLARLAMTESSSVIWRNVRAALGPRAGDRGAKP